MKDLFNSFYFLNNNLYSEKFLQKDIKHLIDFEENIKSQFEEIKNLYRQHLAKLNEAQLEDNLIKPTLKILGWEFLYQQSITIYGKQIKPDFILSDNKNFPPPPLAVCESKKYNLFLDNQKANLENPHFQILNYLSLLRSNYGFLTNGRLWRFYDITKISNNKVFYEIDLQEVSSQNDYEAFKYFYHIFKKDNFASHPQAKAVRIEQVARKSDEVKIEMEQNLKNVIYGYDFHTSVFELIGQRIYKNYPQEDLKVIYENTLYLIFRLLFIFYFEDKYSALLKKHKHYNQKISLNALYNKLKEHKNTDYTGWDELADIFQKLDKGNIAYQVPVFNGGLFSQNRAKLLTHQALMTNADLFSVLDNILCYQEGGRSLFRRDFKTLSVIQLGSIYEGLLEFRFETAKEDTYYAEYETRDKKKQFISGYFDSYDYAVIQKSSKIIRENFYKKGELFLIDSNNSRKSSASYYTPSSLSFFMVQKAIDLELENKKDILSLKIIDNACGSGHFLVEALNYLVGKVFEDINQNEKITNENLRKEIQEETQKVKRNLIGFEEEDKEVDEANILKRILLKKIIYGVDFNPFAVELTKLSLWIDTFVFGTPLSFISHHIKTGNALMGSFLEELKLNESADMLFQKDIRQNAEDLTKKLAELMDLKDTTAQDIEKSKQVYEKDISPLQGKLNRMLDYLTYAKIREIEGKKEVVDTSLLQDLLEGNDNGLAKKVKEYAQEYGFFNYEIEFPEVYKENGGFNIVIGNPPWDKTKFDDKDFFSQYVFNYRTCDNSKKAQIKKDFLAKEYVSKKYEGSKNFIQNINKFYKNNFPKNEGCGDGNLFRFFVEKNLSLLAKGGSLTYVIPSALMFEDGSQKLRKYIFDNYKMSFFYSFENRNGIFKDVDSRYKFSLIQIVNKKVPQQNIVAQFMLLDPHDLYKKEGKIKYTSQIIKELSLDFQALMEVKSAKDLPILRKAYSVFKPLSPDYMDFRNELHMTADKDLFLTDKTAIPLYEGKMVHQFNPAFEQPNYYLNKRDFDARIESKELTRLKQSFNKQDLVQLNLTDDNKLKKYIKYDREFFRLGFRAIASDTNERTLIFSMLPKNCGVGNSVYASIPKKYVLENNQIITRYFTERSLFIMSIFNSIILDFIARQMIQTNVNKTYIMRLPVPQPSDKELQENKTYQKLIKNALLLTLHHDYNAFKELADDYGIIKQQVENITEKQADLLQIENNILIANLYDISKPELKYILSTFKVLSKNKPEYVRTSVERYERK
jgi:type II restriction/modification system DNA methylase subunit YeeA